MATTTTYALRYPVLGDAPNGPAGLQNLAEDVENLALKTPMASMYQTAGQTLTNNVWTAITFTAEDFDTHGGHNTSTNTSRWVCPTGWAGYYLIKGVVYLASGGVVSGIPTSPGVRTAAIAKNGTRVRGSSLRIEPVRGDNFGDGYQVDKLVQLAVGDYVELHSLHTQGASVATFTGPTETSSMDVMFLRRS